MHKLSILFKYLAIILSYFMCIIVSFRYGVMVWAIENEGVSAPAGVALILAIPFLIGIIICVIVSLYLKKK